VIYNILGMDIPINGEQLESTQLNEESASVSNPEADGSDTVLRDQETFIQNVGQFYNQQMLSDVILRIGDLKFSAHKFVLAKSSDVFMKMLYDHSWSQNVTEEIELTETDECQMVFDKFLKYLYTAEVSINIPSAIGILCLADKYNVTSLKDLCVNYMVENSRSPMVKNALDWYPWAKALHLEKLVKQCTRTITWNGTDIVTSPDWLKMDSDFIKDLLNNSQLIIKNEFTLWEAVTRWLTDESRAIDLEENGRQILPLIRFPQMLASELYCLEQSDLVKQSACSACMAALLSAAYRYRALCLTQASLGVSFNQACYLPRDYTDLTVDTVQMHNALRFGIQVDVKMYRGPVPVESRDGDWKITYRKMQNGAWQLQLYGHETAMVNTEARIQPSILIYNEHDKVIQVHHGETTTISRGKHIDLQISVDEPTQARKLAVLIKPVPS